MKNTFVYLLLVILAATSFSVSAQTAYRGDRRETPAHVADPESKAEGVECPPCLMTMRLPTNLYDNSINPEQIVNSALGITDHHSSKGKGEGQTQ